ncbi:glycerol-3-phosphate acyltransferase [Streptomyces sp. NPDC019890]|uniref:glycerol-3-phosphate acyltransferase n=1 Tax=Streptomyces sp. NPDC019890 TaxID=3365064 RepID=UPI003850AC8C
MNMNQLALSAGLVVVGYFVGCISPSYYVTKVRIGRDIRDLGSGNAGAQNVGKVLGRHWFVIILLADMLKGYVVVSGGVALKVGDVALTLAVVSVVSGHIWPVQLAFRGGMGIATSLGAVLAFNWLVMAAIVAVFAATYFPQLWTGQTVARKAAARSAVASINLVALSLVLLKEPLMSWLSLIILGFVHYAGYRSRLARGWPRPARDEAAA